MFKIFKKTDILEYLQCMVGTETPTPLNIVHKMLNLIPNEIFLDDEKTFLCPSCKDGIFLRETVLKILSLKYKQLGKEVFEKEKQNLLNHILKNRIFGIAISYRGYRVTKRTLYGISENLNTDNLDNGNIYFDESFGEECQDKLGVKTEKQCLHFLYQQKELKIFFEKKGVKNMKFDVIIGNPPYQQNYGTPGKNSAKSFPIFHWFIEKAIELNPKYISFIVPDKWCFGTKELNKFKDKFLNDYRIQDFYDIIDGESVFQNVSTGSICYFLWNRDKTDKNVNITIYNKLNDKSPLETTNRKMNNGSNCFSRFQKGDNIIKKTKTDLTMTDIVTPRAVFGVSGSLVKDKTKEESKYFYLEPKENTIPIYSLNNDKKDNNGRFRWYYVDKNAPFLKLKNLEKWKLCFPKTVAESIYRRTFILKPNEIFTDTWLNVFLDNEKQAKNLETYFKTYLFRFLLIMKTTNQNVYAEAYSLIPNLSKTKNPRTNKIGWESDWKDDDLKQLFNLTDDEMEYIKETAIKADNGKGGDEEEKE